MSIQKEIANCDLGPPLIGCAGSFTAKLSLFPMILEFGGPTQCKANSFVFQLSHSFWISENHRVKQNQVKKLNESFDILSHLTCSPMNMNCVTQIQTRMMLEDVVPMHYHGFRSLMQEHDMHTNNVTHWSLLDS